MPEIVDVKVNYSRVVQKLDSIPDETRQSLLRTVTDLDAELVDAAKANAPVKSGKLLKSIRGSVGNSPKSVRGRVRVYAKYAGIIEQGGTIRAYEILPNAADAMAFFEPSGVVFAKAVLHPSVVIEGKFFLHRAFGTMKSKIESEMEAAVNRVVTS